VESAWSVYLCSEQMGWKIMHAGQDEKALSMHTHGEVEHPLWVAVVTRGMDTELHVTTL
jgi:hypothetical protein